MGSNWTKFKRAIEKGDQAKVLEIYNKNPEIRRKLNANSIINEATLDTYMHVCAKHGMMEFLKFLLYENNGNPNKLNRYKQTVLHRVCQGSKDNDQYECIKLILQWQDKSLSASMPSKPNPACVSHLIDPSSKQNLLLFIDVNAKDDRDNTPLHYAAMSNLPSCVQTLVTHGAYLFVENAERSTPCDLAENNGRKDIALYLESKMLFSKEDDDKDLIDEEPEVSIVEEKQKFGLRIQDLQEEKEKLLLETSEILLCNIFTAEILLKKHAWSKENLLKAWIEDPIKCCELCGIPSSAIETIPTKITFNEKNNRLTDKITNDEWNNSNNSNAENIIELVKFKVRQFDYDSNLIIARKMSGRYVHKKVKQQKREKNEINNENNKATTNNESSENNDKNSFNENLITSIDENVMKTSDDNELLDDDENSKQCNICLEIFDNEINSVTNIKASLSLVNNNDLIRILCGHKFCKMCWEQYLTMKIEEGNVSDIVCPQIDCYAILPPEIVENLVSPETAQKYLQFDLKAFVDTNPSIKWCPYPGCGMAVRNPRFYMMENSSSSSDYQHLSLNADDLMSYQLDSKMFMMMDYSRSVDCGNGHYFCWECLQEGHEPASCQNWKDWYQKIIEIKPEELSNTHRTEELSANYLWLVTNSKKCPNPNCHAPIQKNEGCNHIKCYRCKHDFCWICLEPWKKHSSSTGGYFQCNRYEASAKIIQKEKNTIAEAEEVHLKAVELNKFVHYYTRFKNHELSYKIEEPLLATAKTKFEILIAQQKTQQQEQQNQNNLINNLDEIRPQTSLTNIPLKSELTSIKNEISIDHSSQHSNASFSKINTHLNKITLYSSENDLTKIKVTEKESDIKLGIKSSSVAEVERETISEIEQSHKNSLSQAETSSNDQPANVNTNSDAHVFIEDAIKELLKARRILRCSYVYGYFLDTFGHKKFIFEFIQTEFEEFTENLSQIIARPHLKTPRNKIIRLTNLLRRKRIEFLESITRGLNSFNDTPPTLKKYSRQRWKYLLKDNIQNDDEFKKSIALSLKELNPKNPWIVDKKGRHTNLLALLNDWPELENDLDSILTPCKDKNQLCANKICSNLKSINTLSGSMCNYCSIKCMREDHKNYLESKKSSFKTTLEPSFQASTSKAVTLSEISLLNDSKKSLFSKNKSQSIECTSINNQFSNGSISSLKESLGKSSSSNSKREENMDGELQRAIEMKNFHQILQNCKKSNDRLSNFSKFEADINKAIGSSIRQKVKNDGLNPTTSSNSDIYEKYHTILPYEPIFLNTKQNDISVIIKNIENVLYEKKDADDKTAKVCNFNIKIKKC